MDTGRVTIALDVRDLTGPLGHPFLVVSLQLDRHPQQLVVLRNTKGAWVEVKRHTFPEGPLSSQELIRMEALLLDELYVSMLFWKGIQEELQVPPV